MNIRQFFGIVEIRTKIVSLSTYTLGTLYVLYRTGSLDILNAVLMFAATLLIDMGTTAFNTFFDYWHGVDHQKSNREESKVLVHEQIPSGWALLTALGCFLLAAVPGFWLTIRTGPGLLLFGFACVAVGFFYSGGPLPISRTPLGELFAGGTLGSALFLIVWFIHEGVPERSTLLASLPSMLAIAAILTVNNTCDIKGDRYSGRRTLSIFLGEKGGALLALAEVLAAYVILAFLGKGGIYPFWTVFALLPGVAITLLIFRRMAQWGYRHETKEANMGDISLIFLVFTVTASLILLFGRVFR
jgi:1,4-dihydroxy-2-naphthoate polyprenyltransferase